MVVRELFQQKYISHWTSVFNKCQGRTGDMWQHANRLLRAPMTSSINLPADELASFFANKTETIRNSTVDAPMPVITQRQCTPLQSFDPVTAEEVIKVLSKSPTKHCSLDPIPTWLLKKVSHQLAPLLCTMCNVSLQSGFLPIEHKTAIVFPRLKKTTLDPDDTSSYRPISNLSFVSKFVERIVSSRLTKHCDQHSLLPVNQSAYRHHHSTETAVMKVHNDLVRAADNGQVTALVLLDLSAAFDTVDHDLLLSVLDERFALRNTAHDWFRDYLTHRTQFVKTVGGDSSTAELSCGVPQGSVLGPALFCMYTEDVTNVCDEHAVQHHLYADDKQLYASVQPKDARLGLQRLSDCARHITSWCSSRRLQLNASKTELIWFGTPGNLKKLSVTDSNLYLGGSLIRPSTTVRDLGVLLDSQLSMRQHISKVISVCYFHLRRLKKVIRYAGSDLARQLVSAFVLSKLDYCNCVLGGLPSTSIKALQLVQNAAARTILKLNYRSPITPALRELHWLPIEYRIQFKLCVMMHLSHTGRSPQYISEMLQPVATTSTRSGLRSASTACYKLPRLHLKLGERAFSYSGPKLWNALPHDLHDIIDTNAFKTRLKTVLFARAFDKRN
jgi:hypothetical protein